MTRITIVNFSDSRGGAAIAVSQLVSSLRKRQDVNIRFVVAEKNRGDSLSEGPSFFESKLHFIKRILALLFSKLQRSKNNIKHSLNIFGSSHVVDKLREGSDIIHFHWINNETISLSQLLFILRNRCDTKVVFTLHDEWLFCGSEHYDLIGSNRYKQGYEPKQVTTRLADIDRLIFSLKKKLIPYLSSPGVVITAPSRYLVEMAKDSFLLSKSNVHLVPNTINLDVFHKTEKSECRRYLGIPENRFVLLFGAIGGGSVIKGSDLLVATLNLLKDSVDFSDILLVTFGGQTAGAYMLNGYEAFELGHVSERSTMAAVYSSADLTIVPSRKEAFGQVAAESLACETAVVAFDNSGVADIVQHGLNGYLAKAFDTDMMAGSIVKFMGLSHEQRQHMGRLGREHIQRNFSEQIVCEKWLKIYKES
ncbi:glycosyltransferase [Vibrio cionasavignyae]|uniref:glycosyltransferase n=1 Tax=Vibrio cionasavignyae TaxID=2910252 RepID=UPI003D14B49F